MSARALHLVAPVIAHEAWELTRACPMEVSVAQLLTSGSEGDIDRESLGNWRLHPLGCLDRAKPS